VNDLGPKLLQLGYGLIAFAIVVFLLVVLVDKAPRRGRERYQLIFFIGPALGLLALGLIWPAIRTVLLSFRNAHGDAWVGWANYVWAFTEPDSIIVLRNTLIWVAVAPLIATSVGLIYAILIDKSRAESFQKTLIFLPMAISFVGAGVIWRAMYAYRPAEANLLGETPKQVGLLNQLWTMVGGEPQQWLLNIPWNTFFLIVVMIWIQAGFAMVVLSAALKGIPTEIIEAARLDGVNPWQMFWSVLLPSIRPAVVVVYITIFIGVLKVFDIVRTMTGGNFETSVVANEMYSQSFVTGQKGHGAALAVVLFLGVLPVVAYQVRNMRRERSIR
jgi:alpha-glucoside transport system permease protein